MGLSTTYTKVETDYLLQKLQSELASGLKGELKISDAAPTVQGLYILSDIGTYANLGGLVATADKLNYAYFDGAAWSLIATDLPQPIVNNVTNNYTLDPEQIVPSESLYNSGALAGDITKRISVHSKKEVTYKEVTTNENGVAISDSDLDDTNFYIKVDSKYYQQVISGEINVEDFGILPNGTDQTQKINKLLQRIRKTGGTLVFGAGTYKIDGQIVIPDNGFKTSTDAYAQNSITIRGAGGWHSGQQQQQNPIIGGTVLKMAFQSADYFQAKMVTRGLGRFTLRDLTIYSSVADDTTPLFMTTMTTVHIVGVSFRGARPASGNPNIDAIVLGGTRKAVSGVETGYDDPNFAFQGYGSVIERCYFDYVDKVAYMRSYANHIVFRDNFVEKTCGTNKVNGGCIEIDGSLDITNSQSGDYTTGVQILNNYINGLGYYYQVKLKKATRCLIMGNGSPDPQPNLIALVGILDVVENGVTYGSVDNYVIANHCQEAKHTQIETHSIRNTVIGTYGETERNIFGMPVNMKGGSLANPNLLGNTIANEFFTFKKDLYTEGDSVYDAYRPANAPTNPNALIYRLLINGGQYIAGSGSGNVFFLDEDGTTLRSAFENRGTKWKAYGQSGMTIDVGPINAFLNVLAYGSSFSDQNGGPLRIKIAGTGRDSISFGPNSEVTIERATSANVFAVNAPIKSANYTTASRPSASVCGVGTMIFDTTLNKPIWSDGSVWKDATGTAV